MSLQHHVICLSILVCLSACASSRELGGDPALSVVELTALPTPAAGDIKNVSAIYTIGPYDKVSVQVYGMPELAVREAVVDANGTIGVPLVGNINASGLTLAQLEAELSSRLSQSYVRRPQVTVNLIEMVSHNITIDGQVKRPGQYPIPGGMTLLRSISLAEGSTENAKLEDVVVFRTVNGQKYAAMFNLASIRRGRYPDPDIYANDVIMVGDAASRRLFKDLVTAIPAVLTPIVILLTQ